jgi:hypothetical protein
MVEHWLPFGQYRGSPPRAAPTGYLRWLLRTCRLSSGLRAAIRAELESRPGGTVGLPPEAELKRAPLSCRFCGLQRFLVTWHEHAGGQQRVLRADCAVCGRFVAFLPLTPENVAEADAAKSPTGLLDVLIRAEDEGVRLVCGDGRVQFDPAGRASKQLLVLVRQHQHQLLRHLGGFPLPLYASGS